MSSRRKVRAVKSSPSSSPRAELSELSRVDAMIDEFVDNSGELDEINQQEIQSIRNGMYMLYVLRLYMFTRVVPVL